MPVKELNQSGIKTLINLDGNTFKSATDAINAIRNDGHEVNIEAEDILNKLVFEEDSRKSQFVITTPALLEFYEGGHLKQLFQHARVKYGFRLCSPSDIINLRLKYKQREGGMLFVAMEPVFIRPKLATKPYEYILVLERDCCCDDIGGQSWLIDANGNPKHFFYPKEEIVFKLPE